MAKARLFQFALDGDEASLRCWLEGDDVDVNAKDDTEDQDSGGKTALLLAIEKKRRDIVRLLLRYDANTESSDDRGRTALLVAATVGDEVVVHILLNKDADIRAIDDDGNTALMLAKALGYPQIVQLLQPKHAQTQSTPQSPSQSQSINGLTLPLRNSLTSWAKR
ncbi:ankyrin [Acephala macrosclerotiorum]|nr:ankyrin [Acephala macrosclerotiorum]